jgi:PST family polysaccharide transporter
MNRQPNLTQRMLQNTSILLLGQVLGVVLTFVTSIFLVRSLGSSGYGEYAFIYAFLTMFAWLATFGTENILVREAAKHPERANAIWSTGIWVQVAFSSLTCVVMVVTAAVMQYSGDVIALLLIGAIEFIVLLPWRLVARVFQVELQQWRAVLSSLLRQVIWLVVLVLMAAHPPVVLPSLLLARTATALFEVLLLWLLVRPFFQLQWQVDWHAARQLIIQSWPLALSALSVAVYHRIDRVLIEGQLNARDLGYYATADNLAGLMSMVPTAFMASVYPLLCQRSDRAASFRQITDTSFRWLLMGSVGIAGLLTLVGGGLVVVVYGQEFVSSGPILQVLVWAQVAVCYGVVMSQVLFSRNLQNYLILATAAGAITNTVGNLIILPIVGVIGAAWMTLFSYTLASVIIFALMPATRAEGKIGLGILARVLVAGGIALVISTSSGIGPWLGSIVFLFLYMIGIIVARLVTVKDWHLLQTTLRRPKPRAV